MENDTTRRKNKNKKRKMKRIHFHRARFSQFNCHANANPPTFMATKNKIALFESNSLRKI